MDPRVYVRVGGLALIGLVGLVCLIWLVLIWVDFGLDDWFARNQKKRIKIHNVYFVTQYYTNLILTVVELSDAISILYLPGAYNAPISLTTL